MTSASFIAPTTPLDRRKLGKYEVLCRLSTGGMSEIFLAHQTGLAGFNKLVVLKTILPDIGGEEDFVRMFLDEARTTAAFNHPNIAQVFELDTDEGQLFMAMEFVQGCTLVEMARACRQAKEPIPIGFTLASVRDTALALHYAHNFTDARGRKNIVIHRDVAEKNIMVTYEGVTKLLDFGIAKALGRSGRTSIGMVKGTSGYMSPEQIRGEPLDPRSDVFSLGVVMHECLTGLRLFHGKNPEEGMMAALKDTVTPPSKWNPQISAEVDGVVMKSLARERDARFSSALEFARAIEKAAPGLIWHPEQSGELVLRHFTDRRSETRRLLESATFGQETTGEIRVQSVIAKVRASGEPKSAERKMSQVAVPTVQSGPSPIPFSTQAGVKPASLRASNPNQPSTSPARPKAIRVEPNATPPLPPRMSAPQPPAEPPAPRPPPPRANDFDDDESDAKTIPAAALPDEIKAIRKRIAEAAKARKESQATLPVVSGSLLLPNDGAEPSTDRNSNLLRNEGPTTEPSRPSVRSSPSQPPAPAPATTQTGETISLSVKGPAPSWDDDDVGVRTTIARPNELAGQSLEDMRMTTETTGPGQSMPSLPEVGRRRNLLLLLLVVLSLIAIVGLLFVFDVIPLSGNGG